MVAVSHVHKTIHEPKQRQDPQEILNSNQATYKPQPVFTAGHCEILDTTDDGRILISISMSRRLSLVHEIQSLPYRIVSCAPVTDREDPAAHDKSRALQLSIHRRLIELIGTQNEESVKEFKCTDWVVLEPDDYSFRIFQCLRFDPRVMQAILETRSAHERLDIIWNLIRQT